MTWTRELLRSKSKALAIHLGISAAIFVPLLGLIWFAWFPPPFFYTDGGWQGVRIMLIVDMVIGPTLTFLVWNPAKTRRALTVDYVFICTVQLAALVYGYVSVESKRVMAVAYHEGAFTAVTKDRFVSQKFDRSEWSRLGQRAPYWVYVRAPTTPDERAGALAFELTASAFRHELFFLYDPLSAHAGELRGELRDGLRFFPLKGYFRLAQLGFDDRLQLQAVEYGPEMPN